MNQLCFLYYTSHTADYFTIDYFHKLQINDFPFILRTHFGEHRRGAYGCLHLPCPSPAHHTPKI